MKETSEARFIRPNTNFLIVNIKTKAIATVILVTLLLFAWAPWITDEYAINRVVERLGGPDARFVYLGQDMAVKDIPKKVSWFPFCRFVGFPGEAGWFVSFYGAIY